MAREDQGRTQGGQYQGIEHSQHKVGGERLDCVVGCKVSDREMRGFSVLFDQNRKQWKWQTMSDMYRDLLMDGFKLRGAQLRNPTPAMKRALRLAEEAECSNEEAVKHRDVSKILQQFEDDIKDTYEAGDLAGVRRILTKFRAKTESEDDEAVRTRREVEFDRRWGRLWDELTRPMSLNPKKFTQD